MVRIIFDGKFILDPAFSACNNQTSAEMKMRV